MIEFPALVYKAEGKFQRPGGGYSWTCVTSEEELTKKLSEGWFASLDEAVERINSPVKAPLAAVEVDDAPPTREELEIKATELKIKFDGRFSDKKLCQLISEALSK